MPIFYIIGIVVSLPLIIHCIRTGRNTIWVIVLLSLPLIGSAAYFFVEIFPELRSSRASQRAIRTTLLLDLRNGCARRIPSSQREEAAIRAASPRRTHSRCSPERRQASPTAESRAG